MLEKILFIETAFSNTVYDSFSLIFLEGFIFCKKCGASIEDSTIFCPKCGTKVGESSISDGNLSNDVINTNTSPQPPVAQPVYQAQPQAPAQPYVVNNTTVEVVKKNGIGTAGFVCALIGLFLSWIPILGWILWLVGAILSVVGIFKKPRGLAIAGTVISFIDILILLAIAGLATGVGIFSFLH